MLFMKCTMHNYRPPDPDGSPPKNSENFQGGIEGRWCIFCGMPFVETAVSEWYCCPDCRKEKYGAEE